MKSVIISKEKWKEINWDLVLKILRSKEGGFLEASKLESFIQEVKEVLREEGKP